MDFTMDFTMESPWISPWINYPDIIFLPKEQKSEKVK
jgi:hypothetical protein